MSLSDIVSITIITTAKGVTQAGFGTPLIVGYHSNYVDLVREYEDLPSLITDGFTANDPIYKAAAAIMGQTPHPASFKVGKRDLPFTQVVQLAPTSNTVDLEYTATLTNSTGNSTTVTHTVETGNTIADITASLQTSINSITNTTSTDNSTYVEQTSDNAGELFFYSGMNEELEYTDVTPDPGIATDLAAIHLADPDWYGLVIDSNSEAEVVAAQAFVETLNRIAAFNLKDAGVKDSGVSDDVASDMQASSYARCVNIYSADHDGYLAAGWMGGMLTTTPGSATWAYKTVAGPAVDSLNVTQEATIEGKNCNHYTAIKGVNITRYGITPSGEFIDVIRGRDWLQARLEERIYTLLINNPKIPYTDGGVDMVRSEVRAQLREGITNGYLAADPEFVVTAPLVADVSDANKANRILPDIYFQATLAGAIHKVVVSGIISI